MENDGSSMSREKSRVARLERDVQRLRNSPSFRLGKHVTKAIRKPWKAPLLLFTLPWLMLNIGLELLGRKKPGHLTNYNDKIKNFPPNNTVVMFPTNGVGFGHFTRMLAVAKRMKKLDPELEIVFFTTMPTLHLLKPYGIVAHHISGSKYFKNMETSEWNVLLEEELTLCIETHRPKQFVFDGAFPYRGMLRAIKSKPMEKIWLRRGMFRKNATSIPVDSIEHFDAIVRPGDSLPIDNSDELDFSAQLIECNPILLADKDDLFPKSYLRNKLAIPEDSTVVYLQLGAGEINNIESDLSLAVRLLLERENTYVVIGESMIGNRLEITGERVRTLRDYPNSLYFNSFDFAIMAGGYNSYHEAIAFQLPTICIPNKKTGMDDQVARAMVADDAGAMIVVKDTNEKTMKNAIDEIANLKNQSEMKDNCIKISKNNGADDLAILLHNGVTYSKGKFKIPKIIHIMWIGTNEPPTECINSWWEMHPDWEHMYWDDEKVANFAFKNQQSIDLCKYMSGKVNIMRYEILRHFGGIFIDADSLCLKPLDDGNFLHQNAFSCYINENLHRRVANGYMGFSKNYPLLTELIDRISLIPDSDYDSKKNNSWQITGPEFLRKVIEETGDNIHLYPSVTFCPVHHSGEIADNWRESEIYALQYWNSTHRTEGSEEKRKALDDAISEFLKMYRER